jgi:dolichol-phosphate mannosyltransferase
MIIDKFVANNVFAQGTWVTPNNPTLSVIVPTRNEAGNIELLLTSLRHTFEDEFIEVIFVDDSTDETPQVVEAAAKNYPTLNVRLIHRSPEQRIGGLGGAVVMGLNAAQSEYACVMDGDLQHPPELVPVLLKTAVEKQADLVVATRRNASSEVTGLNFTRNLISRGLDLTARIFFPKQLGGVSDPLTGFFLVRIKALNLKAFRPKGFKILMEILVRHPNLQKAEVPFHFGERFAGQSKASVIEVWRYLNLLWALRFGEESFRFIKFALVGASGILVNTLVMYLATERLQVYYLISAGIGTVASTLWNFGLTETWVYQSKNMAQGRIQRLALFFVMNMIALSLRTPMIYLFTAILGIFYVISNLISLAILTVVRFAFSDAIIWKQALPESEKNIKPIQKNSRSVMKKTYSYNVHDVVTVVSDGKLPELEPFRVETTIQEPTIRVRVGLPRKQKTGDASDKYMYYREMFGHLGFEVSLDLGKDPIDVVASPMLKLSPHVLYTNVVEPLLRWTFVRKGYALVHGATIAFGDEAYMITARTDTGKTTTLLKILAYQRRNSDNAAFLSDDMTLVSPDGVAMTYPKPLTISYHTLRAVNSDTLDLQEKLTLPFQSRIHSRSGRRVAFIISKSHLPAATINMVTQMLIPPPKYFVNKLVPNVKLARQAKLTGMFIIERGNEKVLPMENSEAMEILLQNCEDAYGFPPYEDLKEFLYFDNGVDLREREHAIIRQALGALPATTIRSNTLDWWRQIPGFVNERVSRDISAAFRVETTPRERYSRQPEVVSVH